MTTTYTVYFTPVNPMPASGSIQIGWPKQVTVTSRFNCKVRTNRLFTDQSHCSVNRESRTITITGVFEEVKGGWANQISVELGGLKNPVTNKEGEGFVI